MTELNQVAANTAVAASAASDLYVAFPDLGPIPKTVEGITDELIHGLKNVISTTAGVSFEEAFLNPEVEEHWRNASNTLFFSWAVTQEKGIFNPAYAPSETLSNKGFLLSEEVRSTVAQEHETLMKLIPSFEKDFSKFLSALLLGGVLGWRYGSAISGFSEEDTFLAGEKLRLAFSPLPT